LNITFLEIAVTVFPGALAEILCAPKSIAGFGLLADDFVSTAVTLLGTGLEVRFTVPTVVVVTLLLDAAGGTVELPATR